METVFEFIFTECYHESAMATISIHRTMEGAIKAMEEHKQNERELWESMYQDEEEREDFPFGMYQEWDVRETRVLP